MAVAVDVARGERRAETGAGLRLDADGAGGPEDAVGEDQTELAAEDDVDRAVVALAGNADAQVAEAVAVEIARSHSIAEALAVGRVAEDAGGVLGDEIAQERHQTARAAMRDVDRAAVGGALGRAGAAARRADRQVVVGVAVEVAGGERGAELVGRGGATRGRNLPAGGVAVDPVGVLDVEAVGGAVVNFHRADRDVAVVGMTFRRNPHREVVEEVAVEIAGGEGVAELLPSLRGGRAADEALEEDGARRRGLEPLARDPVADDDDAAVGAAAAGEAVVERDARREVVGAVTVEVARRDGPGEVVARLGLEEQQVLVVEALPADGGEADGGVLREEGVDRQRPAEEDEDREDSSQSAGASGDRGHRRDRGAHDRYASKRDETAHATGSVVRPPGNRLAPQRLGARLETRRSSLGARRSSVPWTRRGDT